MSSPGERLARALAGAGDSFSGVAHATRGDEVLFAEARGRAHRAEGIPNRIDTRFPIASGCKLFTALAVARLVETGRVSFDTPLRDCTEEELGRIDPSVTLEHLLTHRSGITSYFEEDVDPDYGALWRDRPVYGMQRPRDFLPLFRDKPAKFPPGERFEYNDGGFILLGVAVESITGLPFAEVVAEAVFAPTGMARSGYFRTDHLPEGAARAYLPDGRTNVFSVPVVGGADGGAYSTAPDLARLWSGFREGRIVGKDLVERMLVPRSSTGLRPPLTRYGYGVWMDGDEGEPRAYLIEGADPGVAMRSAWFPATDTVLTVLGNDETGAWSVYRALEGAL